MAVTFEEYKALCQEVERHNYLYYIEARPEISDQDFDHLLKRIEKIEKDHPDWIRPESPTQRVGEALTQGFKTVRHRIPMLSLANTYSKGEVEEFLDRVIKLTHQDHPLFSCELKMDGVAITVRYENGVYVRGVTRGNGQEGDDITQNLRTVRNLPLSLHGDEVPELLEIRGEVFMEKAVFEALNKEKEAADEEPFANPRNAAAGSLKLLDPKEVKKRQLRVVFYGLAETSEWKIRSQSALHEYLKKLGLPTLGLTAPCKSVEEIFNFADKIEKLRGKLTYEIDGMVIKLDDFYLQNELGNTNKNPRWAVAYKFAAERALTRLHNIALQVGRTGVITPVAELDPVFLAGSTIARASLYNQEEIERQDVRIGDFVWIEKGGDVIPKVIEVNLEKRPSHTHVWKMPTHCPSCNALLEKVPEEVAVRCPNHFSCPDQILRSLIFFGSKAVMDIDNLGEKVVEKLVRAGLVKEPADFFRLTKEDILSLEGFKEKSASNLIQSIEQAKHPTLGSFLFACGIPHVGQKLAEDLARRVKNWEGFVSITSEELDQVEGVGEVVKASILSFLNDPLTRSKAEHLIEVGVIPQEVQVNHNGVFAQKTCVLTGTLSSMTRSEAAKMIQSQGGNISETVSKKTDYVIAGVEAGSKLKKAESLGVKILDESAFLQMLSMS